MSIYEQRKNDSLLISDTHRETTIGNFSITISKNFVNIMGITIENSYMTIISVKIN